MANKYFAKLNENNIVVQLSLVVEDSAASEEAGISFLRNFYKEPNANWKQYDKYTVHNLQTKGGTPFRGNGAVIGGEWDEVNQVFWHVAPFDSWTKNMSNYSWDSPVPFPSNLDGKRPIWNEELTRWEGESGYDPVNRFYWDPDTSSWVAI